MNYQEIYNKLIALSQDQSTTPGERHAAKAKAVQIRKKHLDDSQKSKPSPHGRNPFRPQPHMHFQFQGDLANMVDQFNVFRSTSIFADNPHLKEQLKQAIFGVIKERDELKRKGEL